MFNEKDKIAQLTMDQGDRFVPIDYDKSIINPYFNMHNDTNLHDLMDNVSEQFIKSNGMSGFFLPKEFGDVDRLFGEELEVSFNKAWQFSFYLESYTGFGGMGITFGYGGISANDEMKIMISPRLFQEQCDGRMPEYGDWVYIKNDNSLFEVKYVDPYNKFYQFGKISTMFIILSKVTYNQEELQPEIQNDIEFNLHDYDDDDLKPLFNLDGRLDININEFETNDYIEERAKDIIIHDKPVNGKGSNTSNEPNRRKVESIDEINKLLGGINNK